MLCAAALRGDAASWHIVEACADGVPDWAQIACLAVQNRVGPLVYSSLRSAGLGTLVPRTAMRELETSYFQSFAYCSLVERAVREMLARMGQEGLAVILLRGLALGETIYGDPALRPFSDMDLLIRREDLPRAKTILFDLGYRLPFGSVDARYFERNHLHLQLVKGGEVVELHWALDHKYTSFQIDYGEVFQDATAGRVAGVEALCLSPEDLLLTLCIHLVKHCTYSRNIPPGPELLDRVLADGFLILYCDVVALLRRAGTDLDWAAVVEKARRWQVESTVQPALAATARLFEAPVPSSVLTSLPAPKVGRLERAIRSSTAAASLDGPHHDGHSFFAKWRDACASLVFRPVRALDLCEYLWPPAAFVAKRYGAKNSVQIGLYRFVQLGRALGEGLINLGDIVYYVWLKPRLSGIRSKRAVAPPRRQPR
jgi:hypothetical protein